MLRRVKCVRRASEMKKWQKFTCSVLIAKEKVLKKAEVKLQIGKKKQLLSKNFWPAMAGVAGVVPPALNQSTPCQHWPLSKSPSTSPYTVYSSTHETPLLQDHLYTKKSPSTFPWSVFYNEWNTSATRPPLYRDQSLNLSTVHSTTHKTSLLWDHLPTETSLSSSP